MRICLLHYAYPPAIGGVEILLARHAQILSRLGHTLEVLTGEGKTTDHNIPVTAIPEFQSLAVFDPTLADDILEKKIIDDPFYRLSERIDALLEDYLSHADAVIVHNMLTLHRNLPFTHAFSRYAARHPAQKKIAWVHDHAYVWYEENRKEQLGLPPLADQLLTQPIPGVRYVAISETFKRKLLGVMHMDAQDIMVIPNGIDLADFFSIPADLWNILQASGILSTYPVILSPVNLLERKNLEYGIQVVAALREHFPAIRYVISGKPSAHRDTSSYERKIRTMIGENRLEESVVFLGEALPKDGTRDLMRILYSLADAVFYFSGHENFGLPLLEAALSRVPIFASDIPVFAEVMGDTQRLVDVARTPPRQTAEEVRSFLVSDGASRRYRLARKQHDLETILRVKLVPLLSV